MKVIYWLCLLALTVNACSVTPKQAAEVALKAAYVDQLIKTGAVAEAVYSSKLSDEELNTVRNALLEYNKFRDKWGKMVTKDPLGVVTNLSLLSVDYSVLRNQYKLVETVVYTNWSEYDPYIQAVLQDYQDRAVKLDQLVTDLIKKQEVNTAVIAVEEFAVVLGRIALSIL